MENGKSLLSMIMIMEETYCPSYFQERIWLEELDDCPTCRRFYPQHYNQQLMVMDMEETMTMMITLVEVAVVEVVLVLVGGGTVRTTVNFTEQKEGVMSVVTC